ncbi:MAG: metallophosphoesterase [Candidatus Peribacteria bacterium]|jgi:hypothetical protein|nr:metallophosphoesterase [Candidatus Peribacteria bacterium]
MSPRILIITIAPFVFIGANYYIITRRITIFGGQINQRAIILLISLIITLAIVLLQTSQFSSIKILSIIGSIGSRLFILIPVLAVLMGMEHLITAVLLQGETKGSTTRWIITLIIFLGFLAYGSRAALNTKITKVELTTDKIPHDLNIMLIADIHVDDIFSTIHLKTLKKQIELQKPDLVLIAGDFFNRANVRHAQYYKILSDITIPMYAVEGNHDTMGKGEEKQLALRRIEDLTTIRFLRNESLLLPEFNLQLIGIKDKGQRQKGGINKAV